MRSSRGGTLLRGSFVRWRLQPPTDPTAAEHTAFVVKHGRLAGRDCTEGYGKHEFSVSRCAPAIDAPHYRRLR